MRKTLTQIFIVLLAIVCTYVVVRYMKLDSVSFAWVLNFSLMIFALYFMETLTAPLTAAYYDPKKWERGGRIYELLGINAFRKLLVIIGWENVIRKSNPLTKNTDALAHLYNQTKKNELSLLVIFFIVLGFNVYVAVEYGMAKAWALLVLNLLLHVYPIFLQRYNRPRFQRALALSRRR